jgi:cobalamin biosynthesis protein CobT
VENEKMTSITCECGCTVHKSSLARHKRTAKHINLMRPVPVPVVEVVAPVVVINDDIQKLYKIIEEQAARITKLEDIIYNKVVEVIKDEPVIEEVEEDEPVIEEDEEDEEDEDEEDEEDEEEEDEEDDDDDEIKTIEYKFDQDDEDEEEEQQDYENGYNDITETLYNKTLRINYKGVDVNKYKNQKYLQTFLYIDIHKILDKDYLEVFKCEDVKKEYNLKGKIFKKWDEQMYKTLDEYLKEYPIDKDDKIKTDFYGKELKKYPIINNNKK